MAKGNPKAKPLKQKISEEKDMYAKDLDIDAQNNLLAIVMAGIETWEKMPESHKKMYHNIQEFLGHMVMETAREIVEDEEE